MIFRLTAALLLLVGPAFGGQSTANFGTYKPPEIRKSKWINGGAQTLKSLRGKVVVIDFWAFDCPPCIEAMPHIIDLYERYAPSGLIVIGVHTPRLDYEHDVSKLREAITRMGIKFPVAVDNNEKIFRDYRCDLWPSQFVIDQNGIVRYSHGGVGRYDDMEEVVRNLLNLK